MSDLESIRARHVPCDQHEGDHCQVDEQDWPCDTATVLAALDGWRDYATLYWEAKSEGDAAIEREARLRAAATDYMDAVYQCHDCAQRQKPALVAALATTPEAE